jgi:hypothetical protein
VRYADDRVIVIGDSAWGTTPDRIGSFFHHMAQIGAGRTTERTA